MWRSEHALYIDELAGFDLSGVVQTVQELGGIAELFKSPEGREYATLLQKYLGRLYKLRAFLRENPIYGYVPNRAQDRFHYNPKRGRGCFWANQTGKSVALCTESYAHAIGRRLWLQESDPAYYVKTVPERNIGRVYVTTYDKWQQDLQPIWEQWIPASEYEFERNSARQVKQIHFPRTGSVIYVMSDDMKFKVSEGGQLHWAAFNEPIAKPHFTGTLRGLMRINGPWWMNMTLIDTDRWIYDEIWEMASDPDANVAVIQGTIEDNTIDRGGVLTPAYIAEYASFLDDSERAARLEGTPTFATGRIFPTYRKEPPFYVPSFSMSPEWPTFCFVDPADRKPIAVLYLTVDPHPGYVFARYEIYDGQLRTVADVADAMREFEALLPGGVAMRWMDPAGQIMQRTSGVDTLTEFGNHGFYFNVWPKPDKVNTQIKLFRQWLKIRDGKRWPTFMATESCPRLGTFELPKYHYGKNGKPVKENDDLVDCAMAAAVVDIISIARGWYREQPTEDDHIPIVAGRWADGPEGGY